MSKSAPLAYDFSGIPRGSTVLEIRHGDQGIVRIVYRGPDGHLHLTARRPI